MTRQRFQKCSGCKNILCGRQNTAVLKLSASFFAIFAKISGFTLTSDVCTARYLATIGAVATGLAFNMMTLGSKRSRSPFYFWNTPPWLAGCSPLLIGGLIMMM
jgi:hypothetical protein